MPSHDTDVNVSASFDGLPEPFILLEDAIWRPGYEQTTFILSDRHAELIAEKWRQARPTARGTHVAQAGIMFIDHDVRESIIWNRGNDGWLSTECPAGLTCRGFSREVDDRTAIETLLGWVNEPDAGEISRARVANLLALTGRPVVG